MWGVSILKKNRYERTYQNVYFLHNPETNGRGFSKLPEIAVAGFHKMLEGAKIGNKTIIGLGNSGLALGNIMEDYGKDKNGLFIGSHSRGTLVVDNVLSTLNTRANRDKKILSNTELKMVGPAANVARADERLFQLQQGGNDPQNGRFRPSVHPNRKPRIRPYRHADWQKSGNSRNQYPAKKPMAGYKGYYRGLHLAA